MAGTTNSADRERRRLGLTEARPRPLGQSMWLLASVAVTGLALLGVVRSMPEESLGDRIAPEDLLVMAQGEDTVNEPASPTIVPQPAASPPPATSPDATIGSDPTIVEAAPSSVSDQNLTDQNLTGQNLTDEERAGWEALAEISYPWQILLPEWTIAFLPEKDGFYGLTLVPEHRIEIYVRPDQSPRLLAHVIAHELGHAVDVSLNDGPDRRRWEDQRGLGSSPWWPGSGATDFSTGAGDFAESFAAWQVGGEDYRSKLGEPPDQADIELLADLAAG